MAKLVLVVIGEHQRKVSFTGSSLEELNEAIENKFEDCISSCRISHLQIFDKDFEEYVDLTDVSEIEDKSNLRAVRKEVKLVIEHCSFCLLVFDKRSQTFSGRGRTGFTSLGKTGPILHGLVG